MEILFSLFEEGYQIGLDWIGHFARIIIEGVGIIGLGIIVFTLVLKAITLPFDIYQRVKMRKQTLIMRQMQPELEKLQKQYANDKTMYNQKMMELYKKNGYSMLGACLPMIISLVILIVAFQGFRTYSQYANLNMYVGMAEAYNSAVLEHGENGIDFRFQRDAENKIVTDADGKITLVWTEGEGESAQEKSFSLTWQDNATLNGIEGFPFAFDTVVYTMRLIGTGESTSRYLYVSPADENKYIYYRYSLEEYPNMKKEYFVDGERVLNLDDEEIRNEIVSIKNDVAEGENPKSDEEAVFEYVIKLGATATREWYHQNDASFLWVKNVWYPDVSYNHPIQGYSTFIKEFGNVKVTRADGTKESLKSVLTEDDYNALTSQLTAEKSQPNGYFILIVLSIGLMVLSQFISMRSQKESNQYQTVDGSGARTQKMMMVIMPLMYAIFAFMYSAAFSIYMTMSSLIMIVVTLLSNLIIGSVFRKKEEKMLKEKYTRKLPWQAANEKNKSGKSGKKRK